MRKPRWTEDALTQAHKLIHWQDTFTTGLGDCLNDIKRQEYREAQKSLFGIFKIARFMLDSSEDLLNLQKGKRGPKPQWFELGEESKYFCLQVHRAQAKIQRDFRRTDWNIVTSRLKECQRQCKELQGRILEIMPEESRPEETYVSQRAVNDWLNFVDTLDIGEFNESGRWRSNKKRH